MWWLLILSIAWTCNLSNLVLARFSSQTLLNKAKVAKGLRVIRGFTPYQKIQKARKLKINGCNACACRARSAHCGTRIASHKTSSYASNVSLESVEMLKEIIHESPQVFFWSDEVIHVPQVIWTQWNDPVWSSWCAPAMAWEAAQWEHCCGGMPGLLWSKSPKAPSSLPRLPQLYTVPLRFSFCCFLNEKWNGFPGWPGLWNNKWYDMGQVLDGMEHF